MIALDNQKHIKQQLCKEIQQIKCYKDKSIKMQGIGNHNYGKQFSKEIKKKMSTSIRDAKGGVSDDMIKQIRQQILQGISNKEIQQTFNLPKHTIARIKNGQLVCRDEDKKVKKTLTQIELNISKRKIKVDDIIIVIEKMVEQWKPSQILDYFIKQHNSNITIDIIKNIKRNILNNKPVIYESELPEEQYRHYLTLINNIVNNNLK